MSHNASGVRKRHSQTNYPQARGSHGGRFDPTEERVPLYGSIMDTEPVTTPDYQGQLPGGFLGDDSIGSRHIQDLAILASMLADNSIAQRHLQDTIIASEHYIPGSIGTDALAAFAVTAGKILAGSITADKIAAAGLAADQITSGTLRVGGLPDTPDFVQVFDLDGDLVAQFSQKGVLLVDPSDNNLACRFKDGVLEFTSNFSVGEDLATWSTAVGPDGIRADAIKVGIAPGGHNLMPNSSFENTPFSAGLTHAWPADQAWTTALAIHSLDPVNMDTSGVSLQLTTATY